MKKLLGRYGVLILVLFLGGCSFVAADLDRTIQIAKEANKPAVVECAESMKSEAAKLRAIREKDSAGLLSKGLLAYLYDEQLQSSEVVLRKACSEVAGAVVLRGLKALVD